MTASGGLDGLELEVAIIGSGVGGLYALQRVRDQLGLDVQAFDDAGGVGGTWYWNRYPGCRVDTEAAVYCYSFDEVLFRSWQWSERYPAQPEVLEYLNAVADKHDLKRSINFDTRIVAASWDESAARWCLTTARGERIAARYLIEGVGLLSSTNTPSFPGLERYRGVVHHAARWPAAGVDLAGKRIGVIGTGSTGIQIVTALAPEAGHLYVFQRTPQYVVPLGCGPFPAARRREMNADPAGYVARMLNTASVFGLDESTTPALSVPATERERVYEAAWRKGGGFGFMLETFGDIVTSKAANDTATEFIRAKIRAIVEDPALAEKLCPTDLYAKRPLAVDGYYECFNRDNVTLVDVKAAPILELTERGIRTAAAEIELDVIVFATGFDAITGNYLKIDTTGRGGVKLADKWRDGPLAYLGMTIAGFPNLFMIFGPFGPFTSQPLVHEYQVDWMTKLIVHARAAGARSIDTAQGAESAWVQRCRDGAAQTLFPQVDSWINGANVPGKPKASMFCMEGMAAYMKALDAIVAADYAPFRFGD
ncbi:MAG: flavin-containing monooxygenase [Gammaproteobacteria bacterium]